MSNHKSEPSPECTNPLDSLELWRAFADSVPDMVLLVAADGTVRYINHPPAGLDQADVVGLRAFDFAPPDARGELEQALQEIFQDGAPRARIQRVLHPGGAEHWYQLQTGPVLVGADVPVAIIVARDVTEAERAKRELAESEARFRTLFQNAPEAIVVLDVDRQTFVDANQNACNLFELPLEELVQHDPVSLSPALQPDGQPSSLAAWTHIETALAGNTPSFEWVHRTGSGRDVRCEVRLVRLPSTQNRLVRGSIIDVTEQRRLEEQMREGRKMDALGRLAAGIAHDFNNLLSVVNGSATLILESREASNCIRDEAQGILDAARRGTSLVSQLMTFAQCDEAPARELDINEVVRDVTNFASRVIDGRITIVLQLDARGAIVCMNRSQVEQVIMNLLLNARDAIQGRLGAITISTRSRPSDVQIRVADTGAGMTEEIRHRAFEPFFTTKAGSGGTGLGLSTVYSIVHKAGGSIEVASALGTGTAFDITLPTCEAALAS